MGDQRIARPLPTVDSTMQKDKDGDLCLGRDLLNLIS
jgi:hypothetical protein